MTAVHNRQEPAGGVRHLRSLHARLLWIAGDGRVMTGLAVGVIALVAAAIDGMTDPFWMAREGADILRGGGLLHPDRWSWQPVHATFRPTSAGWQLVLGLAYDRLGVTGMYFTSALVIALALLSIVWAARRLGAGYPSILLSLVFVWLVPGTISIRSMTASTALLLAGITWFASPPAGVRRAGALRAASAGGTAAFVVSALGIWLHASWTAYAFVLAGAALIITTGPEGGSRARRYGIAAAATVGACLGALTGPLGTGAWANARRVAAVCAGRITEWMPAWQVDGFWTIAWAVTVLAAVLSAVPVFIAMRPRVLAVARFPLVVALCALGSAAASCTSMRFIGQTAMFTAPLLAQALTQWMRRLSSNATSSGVRERASDSYWTPVLSAVCVLLLPLAGLAAAAPWPLLADPAIAALPQHCRLFSDPTTANGVLLVRPDVRVWFDGRADYWGRPRLTLASQYYAATADDVVPPGTTCVLYPSGPTPVRDALNADARWQRTVESPRLTLWLPR